MARRRGGGGSHGEMNAWPGYVDALSTLLMVIIFVLLVFVLGRLYVYALAADGAQGVVTMLDILEDEVHECLALAGVSRFAELDRSFVHAAPSVVTPGVHSAFPLLRLGEGY